MSLLTSTRRSSPEPSHSLPPSPDEEDIGWSTPWSRSDDSLARPTTDHLNQLGKGKEKAAEYQPQPSTSYVNGSTDEALRSPDQGRNTEVYPPTTDEEAETRRVRENLRVWEVAERQRRKAARESFATSTSSSVVADVAQRATSFWSRRTSHPSVDSGGKHRALHTSEDNVHLDEIPAALRPLGPYAHSRNPFSDPPGSSSSLTPSSCICDVAPSSHPMHVSAPKHATARPGKVVGAPAPLDLPKPRSPPPLTTPPPAKRPPEPFTRPSSRISHTTEYDYEDEKPARWWTEWLCGCSEGQDRGGEVQAGRTNPLE
ncbi:hypothetical protein BGW80DRAFT_1455527 [Lactifluus volemus]|nr:hypothetical protein BGW80DRAFT_1455527 [Lactifluus volemus]